MKKLSLPIAIALFFSCNAFSQETLVPFGSFGFSNKGVTIQGGVFYEKMEAQFLFKPAGAERTTNNVVGVMVGYKLFNWITPLIGYGYYYRTGFEDYDNDPDGIAAFTVEDGRSIIYGIEISRRGWFISASHCDQTFFSAGIKVYPRFK